MIFNEIDSALFTVRKVPCYAHISKTTQLFSNYATVNIADGKVISAVSDDFQCIINEAILSRIKHVSGAVASWYFTDHKNYYFYAKHNTLENGIEVWLEIVNTYDGHIARQCNFVFKIDGKFLFTNWGALSYIEDAERIRWSNLVDLDDLFKRLASGSKLNKPIISNVPTKYIPLYGSNVTTQYNVLDNLKAYLPIINAWYPLSFLEARRYSHKIFNHTVL